MTDIKKVKHQVATTLGILRSQQAILENVLEEINNFEKLNKQ